MPQGTWVVWKSNPKIHAHFYLTSGFILQLRGLGVFRDICVKEEHSTIWDPSGLSKAEVVVHKCPRLHVVA